MVLLCMTGQAMGDGKEVFVCYESDQVPIFSDLPCANATRLTLKPAQTVRQPPLGQVEQRQLQSLASRVKQLAAQRQLHLKRQQRNYARGAAERAQSCERARRKLEQLGNQRRQGYTLRISKALTAQGERLRAEERANC